MTNIGIIGCGGMANGHADAFNEIEDCRVTACCDIVPGRAKEFAEKHDIPGVYEDIARMFDSEQLDGVSIVTPDNAHKTPALMAIENGVHVMCEKPLAPNLADAREMADAAKKKGLITAVNFTKRNIPATQKAAEMVASGAIGRVMHVECSYLQSWLVSHAWGDWHTHEAWLWRLSTAHGSAGCLGDIGVHIFDMAAFIVGEIAELTADLKTFDKGVDRVGDYVFDANDSVTSTLRFANGAMGVLHCSRWATGITNTEAMRVFGDKGALDLSLTRPAPDALTACLGDDVHTDVWKPVECPQTPSTYARFVESIRTGVQGQTSFDTGVEVQTYIDRCFLSAQQGSAFVKAR